MSKLHLKLPVMRVGLVAATLAFALMNSAQAQTADTAQPNNSPPTRASEKADLKNLEAHGYRPAANESDYPNDIQRAEKAAHGSGESGSTNGTKPAAPNN
jgi:hypothetical protein